MKKDPKEEYAKNDFKSKDFKWECSNCGALLGFISNPDCRTVRMKYKDFYVEVMGGTLGHPCRRCGKTNILMQQNSLNEEKKTFENK